MVQYRNLGRNSGIQAYKIGPDYIKVKFNRNEKIYTFSYRKAGKDNVEQMKVLAKRGYGLNSYIHDNVTFLYE